MTLEPEAPAATGTSTQAAAAWWQSTDENSELRILQVGEFADAADGQHAIALRFSQPFAANTGFQDQLAVYRGQTGQRVGGSWRRAPDPHMLYFTVPGPGRYLVRLRAGLRDAQGHTLNRSLSGPVSIR